MTVFFTADTHFGHSNVIRYDKRPFRDVTEMNEALIKNWNRAVRPSDTVYHLGDVSILRPERTREILDSLNGKIILIRGNHDKAAEHKLCASRFEWVKEYFFLGLNGGIKIALMHYAMRVWDRKHYGTWHHHGHSHGRLTPEPGVLALDVGVDSWSYAPVALDQLKASMSERGRRG
jgi:calcineurin-like phosphoesterase family protein